MPLGVHNKDPTSTGVDTAAEGDAPADLVRMSDPKRSEQHSPAFPFTTTRAANQDKPIKPKGSLSNPNKGGYSLRDVLKWDKNAYDHVQVSLDHRLR